MDQTPQLAPRLTRILLRVAASHATLLAFAADGCDDDDIPSLALMRPVKLQSKYGLSPQQALDFASHCAAEAAAAPPPSPAASLAAQSGVFLSSDLPELDEIDLDSILADNNDLPMQLNPRTGSSSPRQQARRAAAPPLPPPLDPAAALAALQLKILRRLVCRCAGCCAGYCGRCNTRLLCWVILFGTLCFFVAFATGSQAWRRRLWRRLPLPQRLQKHRLRSQNRAGMCVRRRIRSAEAGAMLSPQCCAAGPSPLQPSRAGLPRFIGAFLL